MLPILSSRALRPSSKSCYSLVCLGKKERLGRCCMQRPGCCTSAHDLYGYVITPNGLRSATPCRRREHRAAVRAVQLEESPRSVGLRRKLKRGLQHQDCM